MVTIAHISDPHVGSPYFVPNLMNRVIVEINELGPDLVICSGDLTNEGYRQEYKNWVAYAERLKAPLFTVPGNHDARNVGYLHFEELIGPRHWSIDVGGVRVVGADSSEPDLNEGQIGRERYPWIKEQFSQPADLKVFVLHHHLIPVPGTGRERSTVMDAGDLLEELIAAGVNIVLSGHKHVPYVWRLENLYIANAGTVASLRAPRVHQALLQRAGVRGRRGQDHPEVPLRRRKRHRPLRAVLRRAVLPGVRTAGSAGPGTHGVGPGRGPRPSKGTVVRVLVLVDGEHYPPVTRWGIEAARSKGHEVIAALFLGGEEKVDPGTLPDLGLPTLPAGSDITKALADAIDQVRPEAVLDLSDEPVVGYRERMELAAVSLVRGIPYLGPDFRLDPPISGPPLGVPTVAVIGTGKRTGKTAIGGEVARVAAAMGLNPILVAMGRGGPPKPRVARGGTVTLDVLLDLVRRGEHAASDYLEDAITTGVTTIGARRAGGGLAGAPFVSNVREAAELAVELGAGLVILEGSGSAVPPSPGTPGSWPSRPRRRPSTWAGTWAPIDCCYRTWWCLQWWGARSQGPRTSSP